MIPDNLITELEQAIHQAIDGLNRNKAKAHKKNERKEEDYCVGSETTIDRKLCESSFADDWIVINEIFYYYHESKGYWQKLENAKVKRFIANELKKYFAIKETKDGTYKQYEIAKDSKVKSCFSFAKAFLTLKGAPSNNHLLSLKNGTVDLRTGEIGEHKKENYLTRHIPLEYKKTEEIPPLFHDFLSYSYGEEQIPLIRACISMFLDPTAPYGKAVHLIGKSGTGKGFLTRVIKELVGIENVGLIDKLSLIADQDKRHQNLTARSLIVAQLDVSGFLSDLGAFYELVDNGSMSGRALHSSEAYEKIWNLRFLLASLNRLGVENSDERWRRRIIPIPTLGRRPKSSAPDLKKRVRSEELALILGWALSMPRQERDELLFDPQLWGKENRDLQFEQDTHSDPVRSFIDACLVPSDDPNDTIVRQYSLRILQGFYTNHRKQAKEPN